MSNDNSFNDLLEGGPPAFKFENVGDIAKGVVTGVRQVQQTDIKTNEPLHWPNGDPRMQLVVTLRQENGEETRVFCKPNAREAIRKAVDGADFKVGGTLAVKYTGDEPSSGAGMSPKKLFAAKYDAPVESVKADELI